jgi:hypothetical protein
MSDIITRLLMNSSDYDKKMGRAKKSADDFGASLAKGIGSAAGKVAGALGLAMGAAEGFERVLDSTQKTGDLTRGTIHAIKTSVDEFFHSINRGNLSLFIDNLSTITNKAIEAYQALDQLGNTQISYGVFNAKNQAAIAEAQYLAKNKFAPTDERIKAFDQWKDALANEENNINALQGELINTVTKTVGSRVTANLKIEWEDIIRAFETDLMNVSKRDEIKSRAEMGTRNYEANAKRSDWTQKQKDELAELQKQNIITYTMLDEFNTEQLQSLAQMVQQYYQLTSAVKGLGREFNETANEFNNANKGVAGFNPVESLPGYSVYSGGEAGRNFGGGGTTKADPLKTLQMSIEVDNGINYNTELGRKVMKVMQTGEPLPIITQPIEIEEVVDEDPLPQFNNDKVENIRNINEEIAVMSNLMTMANSATAAGADGWLQWMTNVIQATSTAIAAIRGVVMAKQAEGAASAGASAAQSGPFGWLMIAPAIMSAIAAFASIPKFAEGGIVGGSSFFGDKLLARVNSREMILTPKQQGRLLGALETPHVVVGGEARVSGKDIFISLRNYMKATGNRL